MQQLSGLDATFLYLETPEMPMHVGALHVLELPLGFKGKFVTALRKHMAARLAVAPVLRRRLWWMPLNLANPAWVDAEPDLQVHIVEVKLPPSGKFGDGMAALEAEVSRLHPALLDRSRPLWKFHVLEGLGLSNQGRKRVGLYSQLHHAAVDGQAAVALANAILDLTPEGRPVETPVAARHKTFSLGMTEALRGALGNQAQKVAEIVRNLPSTVGTLKNAATRALAGASLLTGKKGVSNLTLAPRTPLNMSVTTSRAFAAVTLPLRELKELGRAHGATLNDMVLALCSGALRRYYAKRHTLPKKSLVAAVPISLRMKGDAAADNQASMSLISLGTNVADPGKRLAHIMAASKAMKSTMGGLKSVLPTDFPSLGLPWLMEAAAAIYGRAKVADRIPQVANVVVSNVPGPPVTLYLAGAKMLTNYPTSIIVHGMGLNITVQSYDQSLDIGLMADAVAMPDVRELADDILITMDDLRALPGPGDHDHPDTLSALGLVTRASRAVTGTVSKSVTKTVAGAVSDVVSRVARQVAGAAMEAAASKVTKKPGPKPRSAARTPSASASNKRPDAG